MTDRICYRCNQCLPFSAFNKNKNRKGGYEYECKPCRKERAATYYSVAKDSIRERNSQYYKDNPDKWLGYEAKRRRLKAVPAWGDKKLVEGTYKLAKYLSSTYNVSIHVDHVLPLNGKDVCGLHVYENLQLLFAEDNLKKGVSWES